MLKKNKTTLIITSLIILLPILFGVIIWNMFPEKMAIHLNLDGDIGFAEKSMAIFLLPLIMLVFHWVCILITAYDHRNKEQSDKVLRMVLWICPVISLFTSTFTYLLSLGITSILTTAIFLLIGVTFIIIGNYMPKTRINNTIGIRIAWTLESEANWNATHRMAGKLWVICGMAMIILSPLPMKLLPICMTAIIFIAIIPPVIFSYRFRQKEILNGDEFTKRNPSKKRTALGIVVTVITVVIVCYLMFTGEIRYVLSEDTLMVDCNHWNDEYIKLSDIEEITLITDADYGMRTYGFGTPRLSMGKFRNDAYGIYELYAYPQNKTAIEIKTSSGITLINNKTPEETKALYESILSYM